MKYFFSLLLYRLLMFLLLPLLLIVFLVRSFGHSEYRQRLSERLGFLSSTMKKNGIVIHAASVGEVIALKTFIEKTIQANPNKIITVTTFTPTGSAQVKRLFPQNVQHCYLPIDHPICSWLFLTKLKPQAMVFMETELWPNLIAQCANNNIKLLLINGRLSDNSIKSYRKISWLITPTLLHFNKILTQSQENQENFICLGANKAHCQLVGNLKFDITISANVLDKKQQLQQNIENERFIIAIASTHQGDEEIALSCFNELQKMIPNLLLVIIPRHPERFNNIAKLCLKQQLTLSRRSKNEQVRANTQIWLIDTLGELLPTCALANIVIMGGSFSHIGGHNPLEPALFKKPIIVGPDMNNFKEVFAQLLHQEGIIQLKNNENPTTALIQTVSNLYQQPERHQLLGNNAYLVVKNNQGASDKSVSELQKLLAN